MSHTRPTSPHVTIYSWMMTNTLSILHRLTGIALAIGTILMVTWLVSAAYYPTFYYDLHECMSSWIGQTMLLGWAAAFYYHLANGIRHLFWDMGKGFELDQAHKTGVIVLLFTIFMTAYSWWVLCSATCQSGIAGI